MCQPDTDSRLWGCVAGLYRFLILWKALQLDHQKIRAVRAIDRGLVHLGLAVCSSFVGCHSLPRMPLIGLSLQRVALGLLRGRHCILAHGAGRVAHVLGCLIGFLLSHLCSAPGLGGVHRCFFEAAQFLSVGWRDASARTRCEHECGDDCVRCATVGCRRCTTQLQLCAVVHLLSDPSAASWSAVRHSKPGTPVTGKSVASSQAFMLHMGVSGVERGTCKSECCGGAYTFVASTNGAVLL